MTDNRYGFQRTPGSTRRPRHSSAARLKSVRQKYILEALEARCLLTIFDLQPIPVLTAVEGSTVGTLVVGSFASADPLTAFQPIPPTVLFDPGVLALGQPNPFPATVAFQGNVLDPFTGGQAALYSLSLSNVQFADNASANVAKATLIVHDNADGTQAGGYTSIQLVEAGLTAGAGLPVTSATEGVPITVNLQAFTDGDLSATVSDFTATVDWGDGTGIQNGRVVFDSNGNFHVEGTHTYAKPGGYVVLVSIKDTAFGGGTVNTGVGTISVAPGTITDPGVPVNGVEGSSLDNVLVGTFSYSVPSATPSDFAAVIDWGDGSASSPSAGTVIETSATATASNFAIVGSHNYAQPGSYAITTTIQDLTTLPTVTTSTVSTTATVAAVGLQFTAAPVVVTEGATIPAGTFIGNLTDPAGFAPGDLLSGTVTFPGATGATMLTGIVSANTSTVMTVSDTTFTTGSIDEGISNYTATVTDTPGNVGGTVTTATATGELVVTDAPLTAGAVAPVFTPTEGNPAGIPATTQLFDFTDGNLTATTSDFTATIVWGDGATTTGTVVSLGVGAFAVEGGHTYTQNSLGQPGGSYPITITVVDDGGQKTSASTSATVADATLVDDTPGVAPIITTVNSPLVNVVVAEFTDPNPFAKASDFGASITSWGDGTPPVGNPDPGVVVALGVDAAGAHFAVLGSHTYTVPVTAGSITTAIFDVGGGAAGSFLPDPILPVTVVPASIQIAAQPVVTQEGTTIPAGTVIGTFTDTGFNPATPPTYTATVTFAGATAPTALTLNAIAGPNGNTFELTTAAATTFTAGSIDEGNHQYTVDISSSANPAAPAAQTVGQLVVTDAPLTFFDTNPGLDPQTAGVPLTDFPLMQFDDANPAATAADFTVTIDWGDGTPASPGTVMFDGLHWLVSGTHTFTTATGPGQTDLITIHVVDDGGQTVNGVTGPFSVLPGALSGGTSIPVVGAKNQALNNVPVALFVDANPDAEPQDIIALIDWGDGTAPTPGVVTKIGAAPGGGVIFQVNGTHTYTTSIGSPFPITVNIANAATFTGVPDLVVTGSSATISSSPIAVSVLPISTTSGVVTDPGALVATFTDPAQANLTTLPGPITASINWGDGTTDTGLTITAMGGGVFGVFAPAGGHTYALPGIYVVKVTVNDSDPSSGVGGNLAFVVPSTTVAISLTPVPGGLTPGTEGQPFAANTPPPAGATGVELATFTDTSLTLPASSYSVLIDWGDGSPQSTGQVTPDLVADAADPTVKHFVVTGEHTYREAQTTPYVITVFVTQNNPPGLFSSSQTVHALDSVTINDAPLTPGVSLPIFATENVPLNDVAVATFTDANPFSSAADFTATINWGDGTAVDPNARLVKTGGTAAGILYTVYGSHDYTTTGNFATEVTVSDEDSPVASAIAVPPVAPPPGAGNVNVSQSPIVVTGLPIGTFRIDEPTPLNLPVATFLDAATSDPLTNYTATINWGDGSGSQTFGAGVGIVALGGGQFEFEVPAQHTYTSTGIFPITVTINDSDPAVGVGGSFAVVIDSIIVATPVATPITSPGGGLYTEGQPLVNVPLATLTDTDTTAVASDYTVQIDWGDGSPQSAGTVVADLPADAADPTHAHFIIEGSHTYAETNLPGYKVQLIATDAFGGKTTASVNISIADAPLSQALGLPIYATEFQALNSIPVATFVDANPLGLAGDFSATIDWGDGSPLDTNARIVLVGANPSGPGLQYAVYGSHVYSKVTPSGSPFLDKITILDEDGSSISTTPGAVTVSVNATPLVISPAPLTAVENVPLPNGQTILTPNGPNPPTIVATFYDTSGPDAVTAYSAMIDWGNGTASTTDTVTAATILKNGTNFVILAPAGASVSYPEEGNYTLRIALVDANGGATAYAIDPVSVADGKLSPASPQPVIAAQTQGVPSGLIPIVSFTDANPDAPTSDFLATIDWGDGSPQSAGLISQPGGIGTPFVVSGNHTYGQPSPAGGYTLTVHIVDEGGASITLAATAVVNASIITVTPATFKAVEGQPVSNVVVATFTDSGIPGPLSSYSASINWNDGTPPTVTPGQIVPLGGNQFEVLGSLVNGYPEEGTFQVFVTITHNGSIVTGSPFTSTAKVADAPLSSAAVPIAATEGALFTGAVAHFTDLDPNGTVSDYTVTIDWGDGVTSPPLTGSGVITQPGGPGTPFAVTGTHTYHEEATYTLSVTITDAGGATTVATEQVTVGDAALAAANPQPTVTIPENVLFSGPVATFQDLNSFSSMTDFTTTIDWGDGSPDSTGMVVATATPNVYQVIGTHIYANVGNTIAGSPGSFALTTTIHDDGGSVLVVPNTANVTVVPIVVAGQLNPSSDTGKFHNDGVTNDNQPNFFGTSAPFSHVRLYATPVGGGTGIFIGQTQALSDGSWSITSGVALRDGSYTIAATGQDQANLPVNPGFSMVTVATNGGPNVLTIDTVGPRVTNTNFHRANGMVSITFSDFNGSGVLIQSIVDAANYAFNNQLKRPLGKYIIGAINVTPGPGTGEEKVDLFIVSTFRGTPLNSRLLRGFFQITAFSASAVKPSGIQDLAGNALDGEFYGPGSASGNGIPGGNFIANFNNFHNIINPPATVIGTPHPNDPPAHFPTRPKKTVAHGTSATKVNVASVTPRASTSHAAHDHALESVIIAKRKRK